MDIEVNYYLFASCNFCLVCMLYVSLVQCLVSFVDILASEFCGVYCIHYNLYLVAACFLMYIIISFSTDTCLTVWKVEDYHESCISCWSIPKIFRCLIFWGFELAWENFCMFVCALQSRPFLKFLYINLSGLNSCVIKTLCMQSVKC